MVDQHTKLSIPSDLTSLARASQVTARSSDKLDEEDTKLEYEYEGNPIKYAPKSKMIHGQYRSTWSERGGFFLTSLGFTTGLQGICLFPVLCDQNGGAAFVICTVVLYLILGIPIVLTESGLGQLSRMSPAALFPRLCPLFSGVGFSMFWSSLLFSISEACLLSWSVLYIYKSAECDLPWAHYQNYTGMTSTAKFFTTEILSLSSGLEMFGKIQGHLVLGLAITWGSVAVCLAAGIRHTGKLCYITTPITFLVAGILLVRGLFLWNVNVSEAVSPNWQYLSDLSVWLTAGCYVFHSLNLGLGGLMAISSHNKPSTNILRDTMLVCFFHFLWGVSMWLAYVCLVADSKARNHQHSNTTGGPWILFVIIARGLAELPHGTVFAMAMYIMAFFVGLGTLLGTILLIVSTLLNFFPQLENRRGPVTVTVCVALFLTGIPLTSQAGFHIQLLLSHYSINWTLILYSLCTTLAVTFCYGQKKLIMDLCSHSNIKLGESTISHLIVLFSTVVPVCLVILLFCSLHHTTSAQQGKSPHPKWAISIGWCLSTLPVVFMLIGAVWRFSQFSRKQCLTESVKSLLRPDVVWIEGMSSSDQSSTTSEKTSITTPIILAESKDFYFVRSLPPGDSNNNFNQFMVNSTHQKASTEHSSF